MKIATVTFRKMNVDLKYFEVFEDNLGNKSYDYIVPEGLNVELGDYCLVGIRNSQRCEIVRVISLQDEDMYSDQSKEKLMPIVCKVKFDEINNYVEKKKRKEKLEKQINNLYEKVSKLKILETMAKEDSSLAALIEEYKSL